MEKVLNSYEALFIVNANLPEEEAKALMGKFTSLVEANGTIEKVDEWGKRRLAYPINDTVDGIYTLVNFKSDASFPYELQRVARITDGVLRVMVVRLEEEAPAALGRYSRSDGSRGIPGLIGIRLHKWRHDTH